MPAINTDSIATDVVKGLIVSAFVGFGVLVTMAYDDHQNIQAMLKNQEVIFDKLVQIEDKLRIPTSGKIAENRNE
jgi:hypothetical protein